VRRGFRVWCFGLRVYRFEFVFRVSCAFQVLGGSGAAGSSWRVVCLGLRVMCLGLRVEGLEFRV